MTNHNQDRRLQLQQELVQLVNQIDEIDRFSNEIKLKAVNGEKITLMEVEQLLADAGARPLLQQEKERIRAERNQLGGVIQ